MKSGYKAVIFDMDGTLICSMYAWRDAFIRFIRKYSLKVPEVLHGIPESPCGIAADYLETQLKGRMNREEIIKEMLYLIDEEYATRVQPKEDIFRLLDRLQKEGYLLAVATATPLRYALTALRRLNFDERFEFMTSCEEIGYEKSNPEFFRSVARRLRVQPEECIVFEDALYAVQSAKKAGMYVCAVADYYAWRDREEIKKNADRYLACYADILDEEPDAAGSLLQ